MSGYMLINRLKTYYLIITLSLFSGIILSQDLEKLPDSLYVKTTGGINVGLSAYTSSGMNARRDPYSYLLNANLNFNICDLISMPFSATISSGSRTFNQPHFAQVGVSPKYKAVTVHAGYRSMQFSSYTLSGITFLGLGVEVEPKESIWKFKVLGGRFAKGIPFSDDISGRVEMPSFSRWGWGGMLSVGDKDYNADIMLFKARDIKGSIEIPDTADLAPKENLTLGFNTKLKIIGKFSFNAEYAGSAYTEDTRMPEIVYDRYTYLNNLGGLYTPRLSSNFSNAIGTGLTYASEGFSAGVSYRRVDPDYKTLGSTYITNDYRNITLNLSKSFLKDRIAVSGNYGLQKDNLDHKKEKTTNRIIASVQGTFKLSDKLNMSGNYSNYSTSSNPTYIDLIDSVRYVQVAENYGGMFSYSVTQNTLSHNLIFNFVEQKSDMLNNTATEVTQTNTSCINALLTYTLGYQPLSASLNTSLNATWFEMPDNKSTTYGPVISLQKSFLDKKMNSSLAYSYMSTITAGNNNSTSVIRLNMTYKVGKKQTLRFDVGSTFLKRWMKQNNQTEFTMKKSNETRFNLNYGFNF
jgi:hypothetical protein